MFSSYDEIEYICPFLSSQEIKALRLVNKDLSKGCWKYMTKHYVFNADKTPKKFLRKHQIRKIYNVKNTTKLYNLPQTITYIEFHKKFKQSVNNLFKRLDRLKTVVFVPDSIFNKQLIIPENISQLQLSDNFSSELSLSRGMKILEIGDSFNRCLNLSSSLVKLKLGNNFNQPLELGGNLQHLELGDSFNQPLVLPQKIKFVSLGNTFNQPMCLPIGLETLVIGHSFNHRLEFPDSLRLLSLGNKFDKKLGLNVGSGLIYLNLGFMFNKTIEIPPKLKYFSIDGWRNRKIHILSSKKIVGMEIFLQNRGYWSGVKYFDRRVSCFDSTQNERKREEMIQDGLDPDCDRNSH